MLKVNQVQEELNKLADPEQAIRSRRFLKTKTDQYAVDDVFLGVRVPVQRVLAKKYSQLSLAGVKKLLDSNIHESRSLGLLIIIAKYQQSDQLENKERLVRFYLNNFRNINTWDLVDISATQLLGDFLAIQARGRDVLLTLAQSQNVWKRRAAIVSTLALIKCQEVLQTLIIADKLLHDDFYLVQTAVGWVLREMGEQTEETLLTEFLDRHYQKMPRLTLRYAVEKLSPQQRKHYLKK